MAQKPVKKGTPPVTETSPELDKALSILLAPVEKPRAVTAADYERRHFRVMHAMRLANIDPDALRAWIKEEPPQ